MSFWELYCVNAEFMGKEFAEKWCDKTNCSTCNLHPKNWIELNRSDL